MINNVELITLIFFIIVVFIIIFIAIEVKIT